MSSNKYKYKFDNYSLIPGEGILLQENQIVPISNRAFDVLMLLVKKEGKIVAKQEFLDYVWANSYVEEGNLAVAINALRKIFHKKNNQKIYIETFSRRGYRFNVKVEKVLIEEEIAEIKSHSILERSESESVETSKSKPIKSTKKNFLLNLLHQLKARKWWFTILVLSSLSSGFTASYLKEKSPNYSRNQISTNRFKQYLNL